MKRFATSNAARVPSKRTARLVLLVSVAVIAALWLVCAIACWLSVGSSPKAFLFGLRFPAALAVDEASKALRPTRNFQDLQHAQAVSVLHGSFQQAISPSDGRLLHDLIVSRGYKRALEIGTAQGYSALWIGLAMKRTGGRLVTIETDPGIAAAARGNFERARLTDVIDSRVNDAFLEIPALPGQFDFVFMDTGAPLNTRLLGLLRSRVAPGGVISAHNVIGFRSEQPGFLAAVENDPLLDTSLVPTAGGGISLSFVRP